MIVSVIGTGYVGLTTAVSLSYLGHKVIGVDKDANKVADLRQGISPIHEPGLEIVLREYAQNIEFTENVIDAVKQSEIIIIAVGTPARPDGSADTKFVEEAAFEVAQGLLPDRKYTLVVKSTVPIGTNRRVSHVVEGVLKENRISTSVFIASNPEFLREGMALNDTLYPDRIVVGAQEFEAVEMLRRLYRPILEQTFKPLTFLPRPEGYGLPPLITTDPTSSEMIKYSANVFLATKISFINEISGLCEKVGADVTEVSRGIGLDPRIGSRFLQAGLGWGGSCFPKDTTALQAVAAEYGYTMPILKAVCEVNQRQRQFIIEKLQSNLKILRGRTIGILGLAFKPNTDDVREAPALSIINELLDRDAHVKVYDPIATGNATKILGDRVAYCQDPYKLAQDCDAIVLATEWEAFRNLDFSEISRSMRNPLLIDARNFLDRNLVQSFNLSYIGIGR